MSNARLLIIHPSPSALALLRSMLYAAGDRIDEAATDREAVRMLERGGADVVLVGTEPSDPDALELLDHVRRKYPQVPVILMFATPSPERAREAMIRGAAAVLRFPLPAIELRAAVAHALESVPTTHSSAAGTVNGNGYANGNGNGNGNGHGHAANGNAYGYVKASYSTGKTGEHGLAVAPTQAVEGEDIVGQDPIFQQALELAAAIAATRTPVLILGERGTGKTMLARTVHLRSPRNKGAFVELSCGAFKGALMERELFGQAAAGYADKAAERAGKLSQSDGGTLFLNDVEALTPDLQFKLLRVLQDMEFEPVNSTQTVKVDVRIVLGSSEDLAALVTRGQFRQDLYDRISTVCLKLPPLRQRGPDIEALAKHFRAHHAQEHGKDVSGFTPEALDLLNQHRWAGNVRELTGAVERGVVVCRGSKIAPAHLALASEESRAARTRAHTPRPHLAIGIRPLKEALEEPEKQLILQALESLNWNRQETARVLDINRTTLYKKMKKYGLLVHEPAWVN